jgi:hypothetical protein
MTVMTAEELADYAQDAFESDLPDDPTPYEMGRAWKAVGERLFEILAERAEENASAVPVTREGIARIIDPIAWEALEVYGQEKAAFIGITTDSSLTKADTILADLRSIDTGRD